MSNSQSDSNENMVNLYTTRLRQVNINKMKDDAYAQLQKWADDCRKKIDEIYQQKLQEIDSHVQNIAVIYEEKKTKIEQNISKISNQNETNDENNNSRKLLDSIEEDLNDIETISIKINSRPLNIDNSYIYIEKEFTLSTLDTKPTSFYYSNISSSALASSDRYLLMHQHPYLCLIDQNHTIVKQNLWPHAWIRDICWAEKLKKFIVITETDIYAVSELLDDIHIEENDLKDVWFSCTCSDVSLYVSTCQWGSSIYEFSLSDSFKLIDQWKPPLTGDNDDGINDIKYNDERLALLINNRVKNEKRMELKSTKTFDTIWLLQLSVGTNIRLFTCCPVNYNEWLVIDGTNLHIYHISKDGKFKNNIARVSVPYRANLLGSSILALANENNLNLYRIC